MERAAQKIWLARPEILGNEIQQQQCQKQKPCPADQIGHDQTFYDSATLLYPDVFPCIQKNPSHTVLYGRVVHSIPYRLQISFFRFFLPAIPSAASAAAASPAYQAVC